MPLLMTQAEFAARRGVGASAVSNWKKRRLLVFAPDPDRPSKQLVDVEMSERLIGGSIDPTRGRPRKASTPPPAQQASPEATPPPARNWEPTGLEAARLDQMRERTVRSKIENERLLGRLVDLGEYERRASDLSRQMRERTHALIRQHSERIAAETDPRKVVAILAAAFDGLFSHMAEEIEAQASAEQAADAALEEAETAADDVDDDDP